MRMKIIVPNMRNQTNLTTIPMQMNFSVPCFAFDGSKARTRDPSITPVAVSEVNNSVIVVAKKAKILERAQYPLHPQPVIEP
jgi:hypothetical protein